MKFDFEREKVVNILQEMLQDYGRMVLSEGRKCYSLWLDYAPQLTEEGDLLKVFLELGLGKQVVELKNCSNEERADWRKLAIENIMRTGESEKDAASMVDAVLEALGWSVKQNDSAKPIKEPSKLNNTTKSNSVPKPEKKSEPKKPSKKKKDTKQTLGKKSDPLLDMVKQELQNRWLRIVSAFMPKAFPQVHKVDFDNLCVPKYIMDVLKKRLRDGVQQYKYLAYGKDEPKGIWIVLTDSSLIVKSVLGDDNVFVVPYQQIQQLTLAGDSVIFKSSDGWKKEITMGMEGYYLVAMLRLMQGKVGDEVITRGEWQGFFAYWGSKDSSGGRSCYHISMNELSAKQQRHLREWMNSKYASWCEDEILALVDETLFRRNTYRTATVITEREMYNKFMYDAYKAPYADITGIMKLDKTVQIMLNGKEKVNFQHLGNMTLFYQMLETIVFIKQHSN